MDAEVIVIDNNSADESVAYLQDKFAWVRFVANNTNTGYAKANNQGWQMAEGEYVLFLNPDTIISEASLRQSVQALGQNPTRGALGIHMLDGSGRFLPESKRGFPSLAASFFKLSGLIRLFPRSGYIAHYYLGKLPENQSNTVEVLSGAFMMVKKDVLKKTGGFDEQFFMYGEDIDLSYRIRQLGFSNYYLAGSSIIHFKGESTKKNFAYTRLFYKAMGIFVQKHYSKQSAWIVPLIKAAIVSGGAISYLRQLLGRGVVADKTAKNVVTVVVGADSAVQQAVAILMKDEKVKRQITTVSTVREIGGAVSSTACNELVLCAGGIAYAEIIDFMRAQQYKVEYKFFAEGSSSIVGSGSKYSSGETVVAG